MNSSSVHARYVGRFAPSPSGDLHAGSLVAALASYLDARAHDGWWLLRIEDIDEPRTVQGADHSIIQTLARLGMVPDGPILWQSQRKAHYLRDFERLQASDLVYPCACTRREIADSRTSTLGQRSEGETRYPGTCRAGLPAGRLGRSWRVRVDDTDIEWTDRNGAHHQESLASSTGDFVLRRADGFWAYQLAVVVDDAAQGITHVVRGNDLEESTARQIHLQTLLGYSHPSYLHVPVVLANDGRKLSKQNGAQSIADAPAILALNGALTHLGLSPVATCKLTEFWAQAVERWRLSRWMS